MEPRQIGDGVTPVTYSTGDKPSSTIFYHLLLEPGGYLLTEDGYRILISYTLPTSREEGDQPTAVSLTVGNLL